MLQAQAAGRYAIMDRLVAGVGKHRGGFVKMLSTRDSSKYLR